MATTRKSKGRAKASAKAAAEQPERPVPTSEACLPSHVASPNPNIYLGDNYGVLDFETTNIDKGDPSHPDNHIVLACITGPSIGRHSFRCNEFEMEPLLALIERCDVLVAQAAQFEAGWLIRCGAEVGNIVWYDTLLAAYAEDGNRKRPRHLDALAEREGIVQRKVSGVKGLIEAGICPSEINDEWLEAYCWGDVDVTQKVFLSQRKRLHDRALLPFLYTKCLFLPILADLERRGMCLDPERVTETYEEITKEYNEVIRQLAEFTGGINPRSPPQMAEFIYDRLGFSELTDHRGNPVRTEAGKRSTSAPTLARLKPSSARQREFIELKTRQGKLWAAKSKSLDKFKACVDNEEDSILRFSLNQAVTGTHRLSSSGKLYKAQGQNLDNKYKRLFRARKPGWKMGEADEAQLEYRTAVWYGQDEQGMADIRDGVDAHSFTSHIIFGTPNCNLKDFGDKYKKQRYDSKAHTFKPLYGGSSGTPRERAYYQAFRDKHPGVSGTQKDWTYHVLEHKWLDTPTGLRFYWPDTEMVGRHGYITNTTNIYNYPVQYLATGEIVPIAVVHQWHRMRACNLQSFLVNTVHDSGVAEIHPDEAELFEEIAVQSYTEDVYRYLKNVYGIEWNVPLDCEVSISTYWAEEDEPEEN